MSDKNILLSIFYLHVILKALILENDPKSSLVMQSIKDPALSLQRLRSLRHGVGSIRDSGTSTWPRHCQKKRKEKKENDPYLYLK